MNKWTLSLILCATLSVWSKPNSCKVISGNAALSSNGIDTAIQSGPKTILEWDHFSIDSHESVSFHQFDKNSSILNRVIGGSESSLLGTLFSNGQVYIINPNGVLIGPNARIEAASFLASSLDILDSDFLQDLFRFAGNGLGSVVNLGQISCPKGDVALIARKVENRGQIEALEGHISLVSGVEVLLQLDGEERVFIRPQVDFEGEAIEGTAIENSGSLEALSIELKSGITPYSKAIHSSGKISATSVSEQNGRVYLVAEKGTTELSGSIDVSGTNTGGKVQLLGTDVHLLNGARINASGSPGRWRNPHRRRLPRKK